MTERKVHTMTNDTLVKKNTTVAKAAKWNPDATDRCDSCGGSSRAYTEASKDGKVLYFCGHHTHQYEATLISSGWDLDIRLHILEDECAKYKAVSDDNF